MLGVRRPPTRAPAPVEGGLSGPVMLATFDVPFDPDAAVVAVDAAVESGLPLIVCNSVQLPPMPLSIVMGYDQLEYPPDMEESLVAPVRLASSLGIKVERIRVRSLRPLEALLEVAREHRLSLLVLGPDRTCLSRRRYQRMARAVRDGAPCLIWLAEGTC